MSNESRYATLKKVASVMLAMALVCSLTPIANALDDPENQPPEAVVTQEAEAAEVAETENAEVTPAVQSETEATLPTEEEPVATPAAEEETQIFAQSEAAYTIASFVGYQDMFTALAKTKIDGDQKSTEAALNLPSTLWVLLDDASLTAYQADHAAEYAASEAARTAHNDALAGGTPAEATAADPYSNVTIPEDAVQVAVTAWTCRDNYEATDYELYTFDPTLDADFGPASGVDLPFLEVEVGEVKVGARADYLAENEWIAAVNTYTTGKDATQAEHFYDSVPFTSTGGGNLDWQSAPTGTPVWDGNEAGSCPNDGVATYNPTTVGELLKAFRDIMANTDTTKAFTINIQNDMDMAGQNGFLWPSDIKFNHTLTLNGNGHTLYNLYMKSQTANCGFIQQINNGYSFYSNDLKIDGANVLGATVTGSFVGLVSTTAQEVQITGCSVRNALTISRGDNCGGLIGRFAMDDTKYSRSLDNCNARNVVALGAGHIGTLTGAIALKGSTTTTNYINRCYAVGGVVVSFGGHSGGLFSCMGGADFGISNCFVDAQVYGQVECGVFSGVSNPLTRVAFMNCFSSGFVDGNRNLGGFLGSLTSGSQVYFFDCYSTALVGVNSSGEYLGGFLGYAANGTTTGPISCYSNCYAAGEVGNASTNSAGAAPGQTETIGGFLGCTRLSLSIMANCFYDKQTTAMREFDVGGPECLSVNSVNATYTDYSSKILKASAGDIGLLGTLTSTTTKSGAGLTSAGDDPVTITTLGPSGTTSDGTTVNVGFTGMRDDRECFKYTVNNTSKGWNDSTDFAANAFGWDTSKSGHYPELIAFSANKAGFSAEDAAIAAAYSKSSTSTAKLETWEKGLDPATGNTEGTALDATTYDTVRDITIRFDLTKDATNWTTTGTQDGVAGTHATSTIKGVTKNVLALLDDGSPYADQFTPGMEWLQVTATANGQDATRRFRVTPSASLDAGESKNVYETTENPSALYDHANDVEFYYTTASRWATNNNDVTTGVYPDTSPSGTTFPAGGGRTPDAITSSQTNFANSAADSLFDSFFGTGGTDTNDHYGVVVGNDNNKSYPGVDMSYMARDYNQNIDADTTGATNSAKGSKVFTYIRPIEYFDASDNNKIITGDMLDLTVQENSDSFNGYKAFQSENTQYLVEYVWELADGRIVRDAKIVTIKSVPFDVNVDVYESGAIDSTVAAQKDALHDSDDALVGVVSGVTDVANDVDFPNTVSNATEHSVKAGVGVKTVAGWTVTNPLKQVNKIKIDFIFEPKIKGGQAQHYSTVLEDPKAGDKITVPYKFWRIVTLSNGDYYSIPINLDREYEVGEKTVNGVTYQYLFFDLDKTDEETGIKVLDMEDDAQVDVELSEVLMLHKSIEGDYADKTKAFDFDIYYTDAAARADAATHKGKTYTYQVWDDNGTPDNYSDDVTVKDLLGKPVTGTITAYDDSYATKSGTVKLTDNQYISVLGGTAGDTYRFVETGVTDYTTTVSAEDGTLGSKQWAKSDTLLASTEAADTGALALPELTKVTTDAEGNTTYESTAADYSRTNYVNTYKEVVPSGVSSEAQWPWLLIAGALVIAAIGGGYALYRKRTKKVTVHAK